ncbi:hypothetical protein GC105_06455 [Alkalibaculum sp. M08DMB]|uniref:Uncharacterized protein n=1 Tax=Alkalibaculum sporogenes TaxID=2655001 RepID=A0A6A7K7Q8_9FIRM|nr:hypothetical protein [Alkalibaculum sporogenes]MPW25426.1 hypothetical protein [Alkalibaculum sporogenes]
MKFKNISIKTVAVTLLILLICNLPVYASTAQLQDISNMDYSNLPSKQLKVLENEVINMSSDEYDEFIHNNVIATDDFTLLQKNLSKVGVELSKNKIITEDQIGILAVPASGSTINTYNSRQPGANYETIHCDFTLKYGESRPATYDVIIIYYDSTKADYHSYGTQSGVTSLKTAANITKGTGVFNFFDTNYRKNGYCTIRIQRKNQGVTRVNYGADFVHTYNTTSTSTSGSANVSFGGTGTIGGSVGVNVKISSAESKWSIADTGYWKP